MIKLLNALLIVAVLLAAFTLYSVEFSKRATKREILALQSQILDEKEGMKLLTAELSSLLRPERLQILARQHLDMRTPSQLQFVKANELALRLPERTKAFEANQTPDPVGAMIESFAQ